MKHRWLRLRRRLLRNRAFEQPFASLMESDVPSATALFRDVEFVSLDIETTSLDPVTAEMLSVGWVVVRNGKVDIATAETYIVQPSGEVGNSASVHGLTDTLVASGLHWTVALSKVVEVLAGRVLLVHHAGLDKALLDRMCVHRYGAPLLVNVVDTLAIERRRQRRKHHIEASQSLRLSDLRDAYRLPRYRAHDCLVDAIASAELLIAIAAHGAGVDRTTLADL